MESMHTGHRKRTKAEFLARPDTFPDHKLLEMLLYYSIPRRDTNPLAHNLIDRFGSLHGVMDALPEELEKLDYVSENTVVLLKLAKALSGRYLADRIDQGEQVKSTAAAKRLLQPYFFGARNELVCAICMDGKGKCLGVRQLSEGNTNAAEVTARKIVEVALSLNASAVILAHNHTSGLALPSAEDKATTQYLAKVLRAVGVSLEDHMIFCDEDVVSLRDSGFDFFV